ncbi:translation initiation factor IF-2 [Actinomadura verrucosospora]|uniref:Translation initiation factor IF-2 n=1 Tax=Actinomadura verrucosospora TaxID=46165 RepID=A0A7D4AM14_ACTVE|nr:translation initiation factor IF-2 [Actinomadura verrucosospora]QKG21788.1 hypothetical protein ACTIVE_3426 [Actinomadura verrucosospora]
MRRLVITLSAAGLALAGCGGAPFSASGGSAEENAVKDARKNADKAGDKLYSSRVWPAQDVAHHAARLDGVEVMKVTGTSTAGRGIRLVLRTSGTGATWDDDEPVTVKRCYELRFSTTTEWGRYGTHEVACPPGAPLTFKPWPKTPKIPTERLRKALPRVRPGGRVDEAKVRAAIASLHLDPGIRVEVQRKGDVVGVALTVRPYPYLDDALDCTLARVAPGSTSTFVPSRMQRMPGEGGCDVGNAIDPEPPPH